MREFWANEAAMMRDKSHLGIDTITPTKKGNPKIIKEGLKIKVSDEIAIIFYNGELYTSTSATDNSGVLYDGTDAFVLNVKKTLNALWESTTARMIVQQLQSDKKNVFLVIQSEAKGEGSHAVATMGYWNDKNPEKVITETNSPADASINLIHELGHLYNYSKGFNYSGYADSWEILPLEEEQTAHLENLVRFELRKPLRTVYNVEIVKNKKRIFTRPGYTYK